MPDVSMYDIATVSAVVSALVTVFGNAFNIPKKY
ncbi:HpcH/HpaI aldolase/citrate lyase family protein [Bacillus sp. FJAT-45350]|nr:HpcH/HpaI aldolase/citrate lyase family protein [Bacillus sp. FJAT-45350]